MTADRVPERFALLANVSAMEEPLVHESGPVPVLPARLAAAACGIAVVLLLGFCAFYVYEIGQGATDDAVRAVMSIVLMLTFALGLGALAKGWLARAAWPRTPTVVWHVLLLPVAWGLFQGHRPLIGAAVGALALLGILAAATARPADSPQPSTFPA